MKPSEKVIKKILDEQTKPVPRWKFVFKNKLLWLVFVISVLLGAIAFSVILFSIQQTDFKVISHMSHSGLELFLGLLPFFWIALLILFLIVAMYCIQHSQRGYKFTLARLAGYNAALSVLLGTLFFIGGGAQRLEHAFAIQVSIYESIQEKKISLWSNPESGYLSGEIEQASLNTFQLVDFAGQSWTVHYAEAFVAPVVLLERGEKVKLIGTMVNSNQFTALEVRPWGGLEMNRNHRRNNKQ